MRTPTGHPLNLMPSRTTHFTVGPRYFCTILMLGVAMVSTPMVRAGIGAVSPINTLSATGDAGLILSINSIDVTELTLGSMHFPNPPHHSLYPASNASNFDLNLVASADEQPYCEILFDQPMMTVFVIENGGNDCGLMQALDAAGQPAGATVYYCSHAALQTTYLTGFGQPAGGFVVRMDSPAFGIRLLPLPGFVMGLDPVSVSGSVRPSLQWYRDPISGAEQLIWHGTASMLQQKSAFDAIWSDVPDATSPYAVTFDGNSRIFRLRSASNE